MNDVPMMDEAAQRVYLNSMLSNPELFTRVNNIIRPEYFDPHLAKGVKFLQEYFSSNRCVPHHSIFTAATKVTTENVPLPRGDLQFITDQIAEFCRFRAVISAVQASIELIEKGDLGTMVKNVSEASKISLVTDLGINYFENPEERLDHADNEVLISTGWKSVDDVIGGGIGRQELITFLAPSGGGKSVAMLNLGRNLLEQGLNGVYISLEMSDRKVATRTDQMLARMESGKIGLNKLQVANEIRKFGERCGAKFFIKRFREGSNANDISAYLRELETQTGFRPDFIIVDYLDIMSPVQKGAGDSMFLKDKFVSEEVRAIGFDYDCIMISASQLGKHSTEAINDGKKMHQGDVQGGSSKTNTSDLMIATVKTDAMHEAGEYRFEFPKARNSDAATKTVTMKWDKKSLLISDMSALVLKKRTPALQMSGVTPGEKPKTIADLG